MHITHTTLPLYPHHLHIYPHHLHITHTTLPLYPHHLHITHTTYVLVSLVRLGPAPPLARKGVLGVFQLLQYVGYGSNMSDVCVMYVA